MRRVGVIVALGALLSMIGGAATAAPALQGRFTRSDLPREAAMRRVRAVSALAARPRTRVRRIAVITVIVVATALLVILLLGGLALTLMYVACSHDPSCTPL